MDKGLAVKIAKRILREHEKGRSYRVIVKEDYPCVKPGTLNRFAKSEGKWIPKEDEILIALGLKKAPKPRKEAWLTHKVKLMAARTKTAIMTNKELKREAQEIRDVVEWLG